MFRFRVFWTKWSIETISTVFHVADVLLLIKLTWSQFFAFLTAWWVKFPALWPCCQFVYCAILPCWVTFPTPGTAFSTNSILHSRKKPENLFPGGLWTCVRVKRASGSFQWADVWGVSFLHKILDILFSVVRFSCGWFIRFVGTRLACSRSLIRMVHCYSSHPNHWPWLTYHFLLVTCYRRCRAFHTTPQGFYSATKALGSSVVLPKVPVAED